MVTVIGATAFPLRAEERQETMSCPIALMVDEGRKGILLGSYGQARVNTTIATVVCSNCEWICRYKLKQAVSRCCYISVAGVVVGVVVAVAAAAAAALVGVVVVVVVVVVVAAASAALVVVVVVVVVVAVVVVVVAAASTALLVVVVVVVLQACWRLTKGDQPNLKKIEHWLRLTCGKLQLTFSLQSYRMYSVTPS